MFILKTIKSPVLLTLIAITSLLSGCFQKTHVLNGYISVAYFLDSKDLSSKYEGVSCSSIPEGQRVLRDINIGAQITLKDSKAEITSITSIKDGIVVPNPSRYSSMEGYTFFDCQFTFSFTDIKESKFYQLEIDKKTIILSLKELQQKKWRIELVHDLNLK